MPEKRNRTANFIEVKGARVHNLKNIDIKIPRDKLIVFTGLSGSGKSSLAFDTLYAEGQRRFVESLSSYARQFLGRMNKPDVDFITGIPPAIAIEQKVNTRNPRSTVGTSTEVYEYIKLLFSRIGKTFSPVSGRIVKHHTVTDVVNFILKFNEGTKVIIITKIALEKDRPITNQLEQMIRLGNTRIEYQGDIIKIDELIKKPDFRFKENQVSVIIDRLFIKNNDDFNTRAADSIQTAFYEGKGRCIIKIFSENEIIEEKFSNIFEADGIKFDEPDVHMFSFNNPLGACKLCEGYGMVIGIDENLVIPDKSLSVYEEAIACWRGEKMKRWKDRLIYNADKCDFPIHKPYIDLTNEQKELLWAGCKYFKGINTFFHYLEKKNYKIQYRVMLARYRGKTICPECKGTRLKKETTFVKVNGKNIQDLILMPLSSLKKYFNCIKLDKHDQIVADRLLIEIKSRINFLCDVGLDYLTLNRLSSTLSGGESQRINISTSLGSSLVGSLYILDEPSIGLHPRDTNRLIKILRQLQKIGNTVIIVEHDENIINAADEIVDIGPKAGRHGGEIIFQGTHEELYKAEGSITARYLNGMECIEVPLHRRKWQNYIEVYGAYENNLKGINVKFPLNVMTVVTGVSGSGKSSLVRDVLYNSIQVHFNGIADRPGRYKKLGGDLHLITNAEFVNQNPIGKSSRSNPVTYIKAYDEIRKLFASLPLAKLYNFSPSHFSFNVDGGRCEECQGEGTITVEMQFMADIELVCESCGGKRFKDEVLEVLYQGKSIYDLLESTVDEAIELFEKGKSNTEKKIAEKLKPLSDVGLGYIKLGQSSSTLSGGESQRVKLASFLTKENMPQPRLFIFDEPTTGLHFHDIKKLLDALNALIKKGHSIVIIEHNMEIIKCADWIIDLGPEGGEEGGYIVSEGTPEELIKCENSYTGLFLKEKLHVI